MGNNVYGFGISLYILNVTGSAMGFAINLLCNTLPRVIFSPISGHIADHYPRKIIIIISQSTSLLIISALLIYSYLNGLHVLAIYITTALLSVFSMFTGLTLTSSIANLVNPERIQKAVAFNQASISISTIGGPIVGGLLYGFYPIEVFLLIFILSFSVALALQSSMDFKLYTSSHSKPSKKAGLLISLKEGYAYVKDEKILWTIMITALFINFFSAAVSIGLPYILVDQLNIQSHHFGMVEGTFAAGMLLVSIYFSVRKDDLSHPLIFIKHGIMFIAIMVSGFVLPIIISIPYSFLIIFYMTFALFYGITIAFVNTPVGVILQKHTKENFRGRVFGMLETMAQAMAPISILLFGFLYDTVGPLWTAFPSSILMVLIVGYLLRNKVIKEVYETNHIGKFRLTTLFYRAVKSFISVLSRSPNR